MSKQRAFVRYTKSGKIVPGSLILTNGSYPAGPALWQEVTVDKCCSDGYPLRLLFSNLDYANMLVGDATNIDDWNTFFNLPAFGTPFTRVEIQGNEVILYGATNITLRYGLFENTFPVRNQILEVYDEGCVKIIEDAAFESCANLRRVYFPEAVETTYVDYYGAFGDCLNLANAYLPKLFKYGEYGAFYAAGFTTPGLVLPFDKFITIDTNLFFDSCINISEISFPNLVSVTGPYFFNGASGLTSVNLPKLVTAGYGMFWGCTSLPSVSLPLATEIGNDCFGYCASLTDIYLPSVTSLGSTTGDDGVFEGILGNTITLTVPAALMTCNSGFPDGDIQYLQANNTVTVITV